MFKVGDKVTWSSQSGGSTTQKTGTIVAVVPASTHVSRVKLSPEIEQLTRMYDRGQRNHKSYLVTVKTSKTEKAAPKLYWPRVSMLHPAE